MLDNSDLIERMANQAKALGTDNLMNILKNYARIDGASAKKTIYVGVVGFPNVGKSSLINSLKRNRAVATGNTPGVTKSMQEVQLDKNIILLDSPGVVLSTQEQSDSLILRQAIKVEQVDDPLRIVEALMARIDHEELQRLYVIEKVTTLAALLGHISHKKGFLKSGGAANFDQAARSIIRDYLDGKMHYFTPAPHVEGMDDLDVSNVGQDEEMM